MYDIPVELLKQEINPKTGLPYYTINKESIKKEIKKIYNPAKLLEYHRSIETIREMINNPVYTTMLKSLSENEQKNILREIVLKDSEKLNSEIGRLLKTNPLFIGTKQMKEMMKLSEVYAEFLRLLVPDDYDEVTRLHKEQHKKDLHPCTCQSQRHN